jgi:hypothetical protein
VDEFIVLMNAIKASEDLGPSYLKEEHGQFISEAVRNSSINILTRLLTGRLSREIIDDRSRCNSPLHPIVFTDKSYNTNEPNENYEGKKNIVDPRVYIPSYPPITASPYGMYYDECTPLRIAVMRTAGEMPAAEKEKRIAIFKMVFEKGGRYPNFEDEQALSNRHLISDIREYDVLPLFEYVVQNLDKLTQKHVEIKKVGKQTRRRTITTTMSIEDVMDIILSYRQPEEYLKIIFENSTYSPVTPLNQFGEGILFYLARPLAKAQGRKARESVRDRVATIDAMITAGADPSQRNDQGETAVAKAAKIQLPDANLTALNGGLEISNASPGKPSNLKNIYGKTAKNIVRLREHYSTMRKADADAKPHLTTPVHEGGAATRRIRKNRHAVSGSHTK